MISSSWNSIKPTRNVSFGGARFKNEHLYVTFLAPIYLVHIWGGSRHKGPILTMYTCRHVWKLAPFDSASRRAQCRAIMAAITRLSNIAMAYVHNFREWRTLLHHNALCSFPKRVQIEPRSDARTQQNDHWTCETCRFCFTAWHSDKMRESESRKAERAACTDCKSLKYRSRVPPQGAWIFTFVSCTTVLHINALYLK